MSQSARNVALALLTVSHYFLVSLACNSPPIACRPACLTERRSADHVNKPRARAACGRRDGCRLNSFVLGRTMNFSRKCSSIENIARDRFLCMASWDSVEKDPNMIPLVTLKMSWCQRCVTSQSAIHVWGSLIRRHQFSTTNVPFNIRKSVSKQVKSDSSGSFGEKAKEATRTTSYTAVVLVGVGVTGLMLYSVFKELLSSFSPQSVYSAAVEKCIANSRIVDLLGDSVKSYGEESRRGRRQHISHLPYEVNGAKGLRIKFYLQGQRRTATAHLDARETSSGWEFRYLFVQLDAYPYEVIVIEDNRGKSSESSTVFPSQEDISTLSPESNSSVGFLTPILPSK